MNLDTSTSELTSGSQALLFTLTLLFSSPADLVVLRWMYKYLREIGRRMKFYRGDIQTRHPSFAEGSQAATQPTGTPVEISAPKIVYSKEDDDAIDEYHRLTGSHNF